MSRMKCVFVAALACLPSPALAQAFTFDDIALGSYFSIVESVGGQTLTVTPVGGGFILATPSSPFIAPLLGTVSLFGSAVVPEQIDGFIPMRFSFLSPVSTITFAFGDGGGEDDSPARIEAFDAFNNALGVFDTPYPAGKSDGATRALSFGGLGASYFILSSGSGVVPPFNANSIAWEVLASTPASTAAPEPASVALVASGLICLGGVTYRRRKSLQQRR